MTLTTVTKSKAEKLAKRIFQLNENGMSYRDISATYFPSVPAGTLNRIAKSGGAWLPKNVDELKELGLVAERKPRNMLPKWYRDTPESRSYWMGQQDKQRVMKDDTNKERHGIDTGKTWQGVK